MAGYSAYVHSNQLNADLSVNIGLVDSIMGNNSNKSNYYVESTIKKLQQVQEALNKAADDFLEGYSIESAQNMADNTNELLRQLATEALYGSNSSNLVNAIAQEQIIRREDIENLKAPASKKIKNFILANIKDEISVSELAKLLTKEFAGGETVIEVSEANAAIVKLGKLFEVKSFETTARKTEVEINKKIFRNTKNLVTNRGGVFRKIIRDLLRSSKFTDKRSRKEAITRFCKALNEEMKNKAKKKIKFIYGYDENKLNEAINSFTNELSRKLEESLADVSNDYLSNYSTAGGAIGEQIRDSVTQTANATIVTFTMGDEKESKGVDKINSILKDRKISQRIGEMQNFRGDKQSLTDIVLLNTKTGKIARAQSKNHFVTYFTKENEGIDGEKEVIENFRWIIENNVQLLNFISNLSNSELGMGLNGFDISNITEAMANNLWFQYHQSAFPEGYGIGFADATVEDFQKELEGSLEKLLAGQITNFLGVTISKEKNTSVIPNASNIFYLLNGRMKKTADLIGQAISQLQQSENLKLNEDKGRMVIVNIDGKSVKNIGVGKGSNSFLPRKLHTLEWNGTGWNATSDTEDIGQEMGDEVLENIKIKVSLGTSIKAIQTSSFNGLI